MKTKFAWTVVTCILAVALASGCATAGKGPSDEELIKGALAEWKAAIVAKNVDQLMAVYSESYKDAEGRSKADMKTFVSDAISQGYLDGIKAEVETATLTIDGAKATASPVSLAGVAGNMSLSLAWAKEEGAWKIIGVDTY